MANKKKTTKKSVGKTAKKAIKKPPKDTLVVFILDKSGSMSSIASATISGFNEYIGTLRKDRKNTYSMSLTLFDTVFDQRYINEPLSKVKELTKDSYNPDGSTALYDAACMTIADTEMNTAKNQKVLCVIMTDGEENASKEYTDKELKADIKRLEATGRWSFVFLGANQDSFLIGKKFGLSAQNIANFNATSNGMSQSMQVMAANTRAFAGSDILSTTSFFSAEQQQKLEDEE